MDSFGSKVLVAIVGGGVSLLSSMAIYVGAQTNEKLDELQLSLRLLAERLAVLETVVERLPPPSWQSRIIVLEDRLERIEQQRAANGR